MTKQTSNGFQVKFDGIELKEEVLQRLEYEIQAVILRELAAHLPQPDFDNVRSGVIIVMPKFWRGLIAHNLSTADLKTMGSVNALM